MRTNFFSIVAVSIILFAFSCKGTGEKQDNNNDNNETVEVAEGTTLKIVGDEIWIREYPTDGEVVMKLKDGEVCEVLKKGKQETIKGVADYWYKIKYDGKEGWVFGSQTSLKDETAVENNNNETNNTNNDTKREPCDDLEKTVNDICYIINNKEFDNLKKYFYVPNKIILIFNPGAFTEIAFTDDITAFTGFAEYTELRSDYKVAYETWPEYSMDTEDWTKHGCFAEKLEGTEYFSEAYQVILDYELHEVEEEELNKGKELGSVSQMKVILTDAYLRFYFTKKDNKWLLTAIDFHDFSA